MIYNNVILSVLDILKRESAAGEKNRYFRHLMGEKHVIFGPPQAKKMRFGESRTEPPGGWGGPRGS